MLPRGGAVPLSRQGQLLNKMQLGHILRGNPPLKRGSDGYGDDELSGKSLETAERAELRPGNSKVYFPTGPGSKQRMEI